MKSLLFLLPLGMLCGQITPTPAAPPKPTDDPVVMSVGSEKITKSEFERIIEALPPQTRTQLQAPGARRKLAEQLAELKSVAREARLRKIDEDPIVREQLSIQTDQILANALFQNLATNVKIDDAAVKAYYDAHKSDYETVKARHILIRMQGSRVPLRPDEKDLTDAEALAKAQEIRKRLVAGESFAMLAKSESDDTGSGNNGGDLGSFSHGQMVEAFEKVAFALPVGQISEPVKTPFGYHIIQVQEHSTQTLEEARADIEKKIKPEMARKAVDEIRKKTPVTLDDTYFGKE